ncbi:hypothetical protein E2C01_060694 [Portunus trituberculatus]|uniref:Uncharacterized protein n=1 Tax=Portunus trituberculatus TaxID=210409 RepID=A0A5B7HCU2_PORTR|nr:hypothetical protein [Portunus trituberculatus]
MTTKLSKWIICGLCPLQISPFSKTPKLNTSFGFSLSSLTILESDLETFMVPSTQKGTPLRGSWLVSILHKKVSPFIEFVHQAEVHIGGGPHALVYKVQRSMSNELVEVAMVLLLWSENDTCYFDILQERDSPEATQ